MIDALQGKARGRWRGILTQFGIDEKHLGTNRPCARCGGRDRATFSDRDGGGTFYCRSCGPYDGLDLLQELHGWELKQAVREVERVLGHVEAAPAKPRKDPTKALNAVYRGSKPVYPGCAVDLYLKARGLTVLPPALRYHPSLELGRARYPVMLGMFSDALHQPITLHRTYLEGDHKAPVESPKMFMRAAKGIKGGSVKLWPADTEVLLAEGIETAIGAAELFSLPAFACIGTYGLETVMLPDTIKRVVIAADHDLNFAGQKAAYVAAARFHAEGRRVEVKIPPIPGTDFLDEWNLQQRART